MVMGLKYFTSFSVRINELLYELLYRCFKHTYPSWPIKSEQGKESESGKKIWRALRAISTEHLHCETLDFPQVGNPPIQILATPLTVYQLSGNIANNG